MDIIDVEDIGDEPEGGDSDAWAVNAHGSGRASALSDIKAAMSEELKQIMPDLKRMVAEGADATSFAKKVRGVAQFNYMKDLLSDDERLAQNAAEKILERSDGKAAQGSTDNAVTVNVLNVTTEKDKKMLAHKAAFLEELMKRKGITNDDN